MSGLINSVAESGWWAGLGSPALQVSPCVTTDPFLRERSHLLISLAFTYLFIYFQPHVIVGSHVCVSAVSGSIPSSHAGETVVFSYLHQRAEHKKPVHSRRDRGPERHLPSLPLSFSFSPPLCHLWQHLLPLLLFPIVRWACPLSCPPSSLF